ncbi:hypothetical protein SDC9_30977 [bioreactor metagenome]|uniref:Phosphodiester glycosidase domain-containing protein n=1 Tax=bioreactor metagenome TaxID=1076179 RepID=A0A644V1H5_9ZZZZ
MKKMKKTIQYFIPAIFIILISLLNHGCENTEDNIKPVYQPRTTLGKTLLEYSDAVARVFSDTSFTIAPGVEETDIHFLKMNGLTTHAYIIKIDMKTPGLKVKVAMPYDQNTSKNFVKQTLTEMAVYADRPHHRVVAMINADFWDVGNMDLRGPLHRNGVILKNYFIYKASLPQQALSFAAITNDNKPLIADSIAYNGMKNNLKEVTGGGAIVLREGQVASLPATWTQVDPRTVWGYTNDDVLYFYVVDGRSALYSNGMTYKELGSIMKALGCSYAVNFDGGGSTQMMIRHPEANVFQIRNRPSDGNQRAVINGWMVVVDEP